MLEGVLAKRSNDRSESLTEHTNIVLEVLKELRKRVKAMPEEFWQNAFLMCLFHDAGKISDNFQCDVLNGRYDQNIYHELISGILLWHLDSSFIGDSDKQLFSMAIFTHHRKLTDELFGEVKGRTLRISKDRIDEWYQYVSRSLDERGMMGRRIDSNDINKISKLRAPHYLQFFINFYTKYRGHWDSMSRLNYINSKAVLNICDWLASGHIKMADGLSYDENYLKIAVSNRINITRIEQVPELVSWHQFQKASMINTNVIAIAPTGSGKTEAALLWAAHEKKANDKIIYCLPTRNTSNSIYERMNNYFGKENTSVVHSSAFFYQKDLTPEYDTLRFLYDRTFFANITVCTIDQILTQGFNLGFWELKTFHCRNAKIIIDEIHLYQPYTLALILQTVTYLATYFNARFYIMSATLPKKLIYLLTEALGSDENLRIIESNTNMEEGRNIFEVVDRTVEENKTAIINEMKHKNTKGHKQKILIVVNTVDTAIRLYDVLKEKAIENELQVFCYHSRFIQKDRIQKEKDILTAEKGEGGVLLIATQVVEVSLDIDFDILFTENAPIDSLIQRAGRVNRKGGKTFSKIIVHCHEEVSETLVYPEEGILEATYSCIKERNGKRISEREFRVLVEEVYQDFDVTTKDSFKDGWHAFENVQKSLKYLGDASLGDEGVFTREIDSVNVIPEKFLEILKGNRASKMEKTKHELSIRRNRKFGARCIQDDDGFVFIDYPYDSDVGLRFRLKKNERIHCVNY